LRSTTGRAEAVADGGGGGVIIGVGLPFFGS
jgi:hypothetical protein